MTEVRWRPFERERLESLGLRDEDVELLSGRGLPEDSNRMFVRNSGRELELREFSETGPAVFLGDFEDGVNSYWLAIDSGSVLMAKGYAIEDASIVQVNSSLRSLQGILKVWEEFVFSGMEEEDDAYDSFVERTLADAETADPEIFEDEESWWARVFEEVELGSLAPE